MSKKKLQNNQNKNLQKGYSWREKEGRYCARFTIDGARYIMYGTNYKELVKAVDIRKGEIHKGVLEPEKMILNNWFMRWMESCKKDNVKNQTYVNYCTYFKWYVEKSKIGNMPLSKIKKIHVQDFLQGLLDRDKPLSINTIKYLGSILYCCLEEARDNDLIDKNPANKVITNLKNRKDSTKKRNAISEKEERTFLEYVSNHRYFKCHESLLTIMFGTGARVGEVTALTWQDIDLDAGVIHINKTLSYRKATAVKGRVKSIGTPKTNFSVRDIPMLPEVKEAFIRQKEMLDVINRECTETVDGYTDFVFLNKDGKAMYPDLTTAIIKRICRSYNKEEEILAQKEGREPYLLPVMSSHWTRHTFRTRCFANKNVRNEIVHAMMGHSLTSRVSEADYLHITTEMIKEEFGLCAE